MPELPEVEAIRLALLKKVCNREILHITPISSKSLRYPINLTDSHLGFINNIKRYGRILIWHINNQPKIISHLGMTGKWKVSGSHDSFSKHDHLVFKFTNFNLVYNDSRRFGYVMSYNESLLPKGIDPYISTVDQLQQYLLININIAKPIKLVLMDNTIITGIGNIYACEVLWDCRISPHTLGTNLSNLAKINLSVSIMAILTQAVKLGGTTFKDYRGLDDAKGIYVNYLKVYNQKICMVCHSNIVKEYLGNRITYWCFKCQN